VVAWYIGEGHHTLSVVERRFKSLLLTIDCTLHQSYQE
jgi:hypothetical protein